MSSRLLTIKTSIVVFLMLSVLFAIPKRIFAQSLVDLAVHYVEGVPSEDEIAYDVNVYLSVVDEVGNPVKGLTIESLIVTEDSQNVQITGLDLVKDEPINIVLAMDVSGSMSGAGIAAAKTAASNFVSGLGVKDRVAIVTFDENVNTLIDSTTDHAAIRNKISTIESIRGAGTCLYDAAFQAIQIASMLPSGRRAVVLFTDGVDETASGGRCSTHTSGDVIDIASAGGTRTPIYSLGMGGRIDENTLERLAELTGGRYLNSPDVTQLDAVFLRLSDQLRSQYILTYNSLAGPGAHTLAVSVSSSGSQDSDTRNFLLPAMPPRVTITSPLEGEAVSGIIKTTAVVSNQNKAVAGVTFEINGTSIGTVAAAPYELEINLDSYPAGKLTLSSIVFGSDNQELSHNSIILEHVVSTGQVIASPVPNQVVEQAFPDILIPVGGVTVLILALVLILFIRGRQKKTPQESVEEREFDFSKTYVGDYGQDGQAIDVAKTYVGDYGDDGQEVDVAKTYVGDYGQDGQPIEVAKTYVSDYGENGKVFEVAKTYVGEYGQDEPAVIPEENPSSEINETYSQNNKEGNPVVAGLAEDILPFGSLTVEFSDDPTMIGHRFDITSLLTTLGRSVDNDIIFPKDNPVSRHHAEISEKRGLLYLMELRQTDVSGISTPPKFGSFINNTQVGLSPILLKNGDIISLGKRVKLKFETSRKVSGDDAVTYDGLEALDDSDKTKDEE
jgi:VWFA-related protein